MRGLIVDNFAGGGGASTGIEMATGRSVDIAINHDPHAIAMHSVNHPGTLHYCESVFDIDPLKATAGFPVWLGWFSPDCRHFSKAKGATPVAKEIRGLAWIVLRWALAVRPKVMMLENVEEFKTWGPLLAPEMRPDPARAGETFKAFCSMLNDGIDATAPAFLEACEFLGISPDSEDARKLKNGLGYQVDYRELRACDYGTPTIRKRFFMVMRCDGQPIPGLNKPLGTVVAGGGKHAVMAAHIVKHFGGNYSGAGVHPSDPLHTITATDHHGLIASHMIKLRGTCKDGQRIDEPAPTVTAGGLHLGEIQVHLHAAGDHPNRENVLAFLREYCEGVSSDIIEIKGELYQIVDITMRMLQPHELYAAQGFPSDYVIDKDSDGNRYAKDKQVARCGNAVPPQFAEALVRANLPELCQARAAA